jgi:glycine oxidase
MQRPDVLIIGGGIIGLTTAYFLARDGARVEVVDKGDFGHEASWAGAGILSPASAADSKTAADRFRARSVSLFAGFSAELRERTGIDNEYHCCGGIEFTGGHREAESDEWRGPGVAFQVLESSALKSLEPAVAAEWMPAYHIPQMAQVRNPRHLKAVLAACQALGVRLRVGCPVHGFERTGAKIAAVRTALGRIVAERFLIAAGAWSDAVSTELAWRPGIRPVRGQIALLNPSMRPIQRILMWGSRYIVPRKDGLVLVGSTEEDAGFDKRTTASAIGELLGLACKLVPALSQAPLERCWAGLRPGSPDGLPYLGRVPGWDNMFVAAGHFRSGIQLSVGTGLAMKELLLDQAPSFDLEAFRPERRGN